jgi:hypothetical protein
MRKGRLSFELCGIKQHICGLLFTAPTSPGQFGKQTAIVFADILSLARLSFHAL